MENGMISAWREYFDMPDMPDSPPADNWTNRARLEGRRLNMARLDGKIAIVTGAGWDNDVRPPFR
jgi:hypothetical protein